MTDQTHDCPICRAPVTHFERYPLQVCDSCSERITDKDGRGISYMTLSWAGGLTATYADTGDRYLDEFCYIDGIKCRAEEDRFGRGIVIQPLDAEDWPNFLE
jgi:hypothetical protein